MEEKGESLDLINFDRRQDVDAKSEINPLLPKQPFRMCISGPSGSGKTNLLMNLITRWTLYDKLYIFSKHIGQSKYEDLKLSFDIITEDFKKKTQKTLDILYMSADENDIPPVEAFDSKLVHMVVFDDLILANRASQVKMTELFVRGRHHNISVIYLSQMHMRIPRDIRLNSDYFAIYGATNSREIISLYQEVGSDIPNIKQFRMMVRNACSERFQFFYIDNLAPNLSLKYRRGFDECFTGV